ncbi:MAG: hypothetical protein RMJ53_03705 [Chitinophagales bacterium]|nr:hypothetical protein [Chitinophagales bacterium]MDW8273319.1 hypothetical protein [Chitinophagales bacterium]
MNKLTLPVYNKSVMLSGAALGVILICSALYIAFKRKRIYYLFFLLFFSASVVAHFFFLLEMNIELIHVVEYGILCSILYFACSNAAKAVLLSLPVMIVDEYIQYIYLYGHYNKYFEFNDILLDVLGCGFFLSFLKIFQSKIRNYNLPPILKRKELHAMFLFAFIVVALIITCFFAVHEQFSCKNTIFVMSRIENPYRFWQIHSFTGAKYHILNPFSGIALICLYFVSIALLDYNSSKTAIGAPSSTS